MNQEEEKRTINFEKLEEQEIETGIETLEFEEESSPIIERLRERPITLVDQEIPVTTEFLESLAPDQSILQCDGYVEGIEKGRRLGTGFVSGKVLSIDHHQPIEEMSRQVSSTNLAIEFVRKYGSVPKEMTTVINHTDCDSILSSAIMRGIIHPETRFGEAAIAADHTGEENMIADLLQSLNVNRNIELSLKSLEALLQGKELDKEVKKQVERRQRDRELAKEAAQSDFQLTPSGKIAFAEFEKNIDAGLLPALMPKAEIIAIMTRMYDKDTAKVLPTKQVKVRLGKAAPEGTDLREIMSQVDPNWGGRWNAGNNKRKGGTEMHIEEYISKMEEAYGTLKK